MYRYIADVYNSNKSQIVLKIEKLKSIICEPITIVHINKCISTHLNKCVPNNSLKWKGGRETKCVNFLKYEYQNCVKENKGIKIAHFQNRDIKSAFNPNK
jgi:hypothetical protein